MEVEIHQAETHASNSERELGKAAGLITWEEGWEKPLTPAELDEFLN